MIQQRQGSFVGPMQVFEKQKDRTAGSASAEKFHHRIKENPSRLLRRKFKWRRDVRKKSAELRHQPSHLTRVISECGSEGILARRLSHRGFENFYEQIERQRIFAIVAAANQRHESSCPNL